MVVSFGDFKPNELYQLIENKDPLGLNSGIESYSTKNNSDIESYSTVNNAEEQSKVEYDAIPHYLKLASNLKASNINNNADSNSSMEKENTSPTLQVNPINNSINRPLHSVSSGNLAQNVSFKSLKNIQQSHKRCNTNSCKDKIPGTSDQNLNPNLILRCDSNELIEDLIQKLKK